MSSIRLIFVTGGEGFLGRHISRALQKAGRRVVSLGRPGLSSDELRVWGIEATARGTVARSLLEKAILEHGEPEWIIHAAGSSSVGASAADPERCFNQTVGSTSDVIGTIASLGSRPRLILISSAAVYGDGHYGPIPVTAEPAPISVYGRHKLAAEELARNAAERGINVRIARFFSLYGPGLRKQLLWDVLTRVYAGEAALRLGGTGREQRDFLFADDAARLVLTLANDGPDFQVVNGGRGEPVTVEQVVRLLLNAVGSKVDVTFSGVVRAGDPASLVADVSCLRRLGFEACFNLDAGLSRFAAWGAEVLQSYQRLTPTPTP
jgi:UDP-glucose 4-epimerase